MHDAVLKMQKNGFIYVLVLVQVVQAKKGFKYKQQIFLNGKNEIKILRNKEQRIK